jgi:hypothetical protein
MKARKGRGKRKKEKKGERERETFVKQTSLGMK